jgi:epoxyqueuosine reductase
LTLPAISNYIDVIMKKITTEIISLLKSNGASLVGFADISEIPMEARDNFPFGISIAVALDPQIIAEIREGPTSRYIKECLRTDALMKKLGQLTLEFLISGGHRAKQLAVTNKIGSRLPPKLTTKLPHKTIATKAGLGWIGKTPLLITKQFGSAVRLGSILTDATFDVNEPINKSQCGGCTACVDACPAASITGNKWYAGVERDYLLDAYKCRRTARKLVIKKIGEEIIGRTFCGICIYVCPWTQKYLSKAV